MTKKWREATFVGFDVETSGKYPLAAEICEIAAVKWQNGAIVDTFQTLVSTKDRMSDEVIAIHNITNDMLVGAPNIKTAVTEFHKFIVDSYLVAHHAPFDLGFIAPEFERAGLALPKNLVFCSSLMSRKAFPESTNHKLQTLIKFFNLKQGQAHRALDDAEACLAVGLKVFERVAHDATIEDLLKYQEAKLPWSDYSISKLKSHPVYSKLVEALETKSLVQITYSGGSRPGLARTVHPLGLVRNPLDDYFIAAEDLKEIPKRYFLNKITAACL
ncbi:MAG: 3'-5' exonuclease [Bdellovibrionales bacterium]|nr:3'-5' exonuclease [Bdellovibrionales bacterium]